MLSYFSLKNMLRGSESPMPRPKPKDPEPDAKNPAPADHSNMATDPVCGTYVEEQSSLFVIHENRKYFFCSNECRDKFLLNITQPRD